MELCDVTVCARYTDSLRTLRPASGRSSTIGCELSLEKSHDPLLGVIAWRPWSAARNKPDMTPTLVKLHAQTPVCARHLRNLVEDSAWQKRVIVCAQQQRWTSN